MEKIEKQSFFNSVLIELNTIKQVATKAELNKLNFGRFNKNSTLECIYGQMTGLCFSNRAQEIYHKQFEMIGGDGSFDQQDYSFGTLYTPLEKYLYMVNSDKHEEIIDYLKGNLKEIEITL